MTALLGFLGLTLVFCSAGCGSTVEDTATTRLETPLGTYSSPKNLSIDEARYNAETGEWVLLGLQAGVDEEAVAGATQAETLRDAMLFEMIRGSTALMEDAARRGLGLPPPQTAEPPSQSNPD